MAQRSARARVKLGKLSQDSSGPPQPNQQNTGGSGGSGSPGLSSLGANNPPIPFGAYHGISKSTSFNPSTGLLTPSTSSIATGSSGHSGGASGGRHGFSFYNKGGSTNAVRSKSALRAFFEGHSERTRGRLEDLIRVKRSAPPSNSVPTPANSRVSLGMGLNMGGLGEIREENLPKVKRWDGGGKSGIEGWNELKKDPELWYPDGDTLVYLSPKGHPSHQYSQPSFRVKSSVLRETESPFLITALVEFYSSVSNPRPAFQRPLTPPTPGLPGSPMEHESIQRVRTGGSKGSMGSGNGPSPTLTNTNSMGMVDGTSAGVAYEIHFPAPLGLGREAVMKHHLTTRNVFAVLFGKSLVGVTLGETLEDLVERLDQYIPSGNYLAQASKQRLGQSQPQQQMAINLANVDLGDGNKKKKKKRNTIIEADCVRGNVARVLEYLLQREFDDFRNCPDVAAGMLCFAEKHQLGELWREAFCHCVGMLSRLEGAKDYLGISPITKALIDHASLDIEVRIGDGEARLASFQFQDMWPTSSLNTPPSMLAFDRFQKFLVTHYQSRFGAWPPQKNDGWGAGGFTRVIYCQLQRDFACLYDYLVDKDVSWCYPNPQPYPTSESTTSFSGHGKPKLMNPSKRHFRADDDSLPFTDIILTFDNNNNYPHIPHPYPLIPEVRHNPNKFMGRQGTSLGQSASSERQTKPGFLQKRNAANNNSTLATGAGDKAAALALSDATNIHSLLSSKASNELVDAFAKFEKAFGSGGGDFSCAEGRKGRWILIYGVLQTLASISVDAPGLRWTEGVEYFLNTKLKGTPPWAASSGGQTTSFGEVSSMDMDSTGDDRGHTRSHCWTVMRSWGGMWGPGSASPSSSIPPSMMSGDTSPVSFFGSATNQEYVTSPLSAPPPHCGLQQQHHSQYNTPRTISPALRRTTAASVTPTSRSIGVGQGDTTDNDSILEPSNRSRKRKIVNMAPQQQQPQPPTTSFYYNKRGSSMSGDEGDDEADEEDQEMRDVPILAREAPFEDPSVVTGPVRTVGDGGGEKGSRGGQVGGEEQKGEGEGKQTDSRPDSLGLPIMGHGMWPIDEQR